MAVRDIPDQINFLDASYHQMAVARLPMTSFTVQQATIPDVILRAVQHGTPFVKLNFAGDSLDFSEFRCTFIVDEQMKNYNELYLWLRGLAFPESHEQYRDLTANEEIVGGVRSDISLVISNSSHLAKLSLDMVDCVPTSLSNLTFTTTARGPNYVTATVTFSVRDFTVNTIVP